MGRHVATVDLPGPVLTAAGCAGTGRELAAYGDLSALGGFVTRTITLRPRPGGPLPRVVESPSGLLHAVGLQNPGLDRFLATELPWLVRAGARVVVSIAGETVAEHAELARRVGQSPGVAAVEVDLSEPDPLDWGLVETREPMASGLVATRIVATCRRELPRDVPVLAKVRPDPLRVLDQALALVEAGVDGLVVGHSLPALMPDGRHAGLSGPSLFPVARRCVAEVHAGLPTLPVMGCGGVATADDARAMLAAGAVAVQVGSALLADPTTAHRISAELAAEPAGGDGAADGAGVPA
ncbi:hypothetical protein [Nocardioides sp. CFH 31398]|uniref:hypothetical protein n=1 Tax=Nocardioides sp. CFH 31398 TaxID=2919579 RepID=UPI001F059DE1|nr:hypothetical protein [Nocardioides sp. CFH 31398]MCH1868581.1 hypothetical protein [Nocardioides sp. CFH 31398]